jgi:hypothetical protein
VGLLGKLAFFYSLSARSSDNRIALGRRLGSIIGISCLSQSNVPDPPSCPKHLQLLTFPSKT